MSDETPTDRIPGMSPPNVDALAVLVKGLRDDLHAQARLLQEIKTSMNDGSIKFALMERDIFDLKERLKVLEDWQDTVEKQQRELMLAILLRVFALAIPVILILGGIGVAIYHIITKGNP